MPMPCYDHAVLLKATTTHHGRRETEARHGVERVNSHVHLHVPAACALYDTPEDGYILHPKHVEQGKCNKVTLNNFHQAGLNKPTL